jgi:hypothetical protein
MASTASRKRREVCSLWKETKISEDRRPHGVVLRALPEENVIDAWLQPVGDAPATEPLPTAFLLHFGTKSR